MPATPGWAAKRKCFPHLAVALRGPSGTDILVRAAGFNAWVWLQAPPSTNRSEPAALSPSQLPSQTEHREHK